MIKSHTRPWYRALPASSAPGLRFAKFSAPIMQLRKRDSTGRVVCMVGNAGESAVEPGTSEASPAPPQTPLQVASQPGSSTPQAAAPAADTSSDTPGKRPRKQRKPPQDIGIAGLLLGKGAELALAADAVDHLPLRQAGFTEQTLQAACNYLAKADPKLAPLIELHGPPDRLLAKSGSNFATLAKAIVFQQLATTAAAVIYGRVLTTCACTEALTPSAVLAAPLPALRQAGLSERKVSYLQDLAQHFSDGRLSDAKIADMDEASMEKALVAVRGIGIWTVHMFAMFHKGSPDVLPTGDLGVRRGMQHLYGLKELPSPAAMEALTERWRPFRSLGSYYMWKVETPRAARGSSNKAGKGKKA